MQTANENADSSHPCADRRGELAAASVDQWRKGLCPFVHCKTHKPMRDLRQSSCLRVYEPQWSTSCGPIAHDSGSRQYSHRNAARTATVLRNPLEMPLVMLALQSSTSAAP